MPQLASQNGGQKHLELNLCSASSSIYHYSHKCVQVQHQALSAYTQYKTFFIFSFNSRGYGMKLGNQDTPIIKLVLEYYTIDLTTGCICIIMYSVQ